MASSKLPWIVAFGACAAAFQGQRGNVQEVEELRIVRAGKLCARLTGDEQGGLLEIMDSRQQPVLTMRSEAGGPALSAKSVDGNSSMLWTVKDGSVGQSIAMGENYITDLIEEYQKDRRRIIRGAATSKNLTSKSRYVVNLEDTDWSMFVGHEGAECRVEGAEGKMDGYIHCEKAITGKVILRKRDVLGNDRQCISVFGKASEKWGMDAKMESSTDSWELKLKK